MRSSGTREMTKKMRIAYIHSVSGIRESDKTISGIRESAKTVSGIRDQNPPMRPQNKNFLYIHPIVTVMPSITNVSDACIFLIFLVPFSILWGPNL